MITKHISKSFIFILAFVVFLGVAFNVYIYWMVSNESSDVRGLNKIYTVSNVVKNCIAETCKWEVTYNYQKIAKSVTINEPSIKVGDTVRMSSMTVARDSAKANSDPHANQAYKSQVRANT